LAHPDQYPVVEVGVEDYPSVSHTAPNGSFDSIRVVEVERRKREEWV